MIDSGLRKTIEEKASEFEIDPDFVESFCFVESSFNPRATRWEPEFYNHYIVPIIKNTNIDPEEAQNRATSWGLMQLMGQVAREYGFKDAFTELFDPATALEWSLKHLKRYIVKYKAQGEDYAIAAYNAGTPIIVDRKFKNQVYVDKIRRYLKQIKEA